MPVFSAFSLFALAALAQTPKPQEVAPDAAKVVDRPVVVRKADEEGKRPAGRSPFVQGPSQAVPLNWAAPHHGGVVWLGQGDNAASLAWQSALQDWKQLNWGGAIEGVGANLAPADDAVRAQLKLPEGQGLVVTNMTEDGPAARAGLRVNDILLTLDDKPLARPDDLIAALETIHAAGRALQKSSRADFIEPAGPVVEKLDRVELALIREGKPLTIPVRPDVRVALGAVVTPKADYYIGTPVNPIDETLRGHLRLTSGWGLVVSADPEKGSPAEKAGIRKNDILLSLDGQPLSDVESLRARIQALGAKSAKVEIVREGKPTSMVVTPEARKPVPEMASGRPTQAGGVVDLRLDPFQAYYPHFQASGVAPQPGAVLNPTAYAAPDLSRKIDDLAAQVQALTRAIEGLRPQPKPAGEGK